MSFPAFVSSPMETGMFEAKPGDLGANFFEEFLTFNDLPSNCDFLEDPLDICDPYSSHGLARGEARNSLSTGRATDDSASFSSQGPHFYGELSGRAAVSDSELLSLDGVALNSPQEQPYQPLSLPSSPTTAVVERKKNRVASSPAKPAYKTLKSAVSTRKTILRSPIKKANPSPKSRSFHNVQQHEDLWGGKLKHQKYEFAPEDAHFPMSPPPSASLFDASPTSKSKGRTNGRVLNGFAYNSTPRADLHTPMATPTLVEHLSSGHTNQSPRAPFYPMTPEGPPAQWTHMARAVEMKAQKSSSISPAIMDAPLWWNHAAAIPVAQPIPATYHVNSQRASQSLAVQLQNDLSPLQSSGLMIQMPQMNNRQKSFITNASPMLQQGQYPVQAKTDQLPQHHLHQQPHFFSPRPRQSCSFSQAPQSHTHCRSSSDSDPPSAAYSPTLQIRKRKSAKSIKSSTPRTPSTPGKVDFVNCTPNDSAKILTGVAPSGSSKTKARREKEALEKRRKLSMAALQAVQAAGGDVESLVKQGLLC